MTNTGVAAGTFRPESTREFFGLESKWLSIGDERIHYHDEGSGTPVVLLHGSAIGVSAAANWWRVIPRMAVSARVLAPDMGGYGWTSVPDESYYGLPAWTEQVVRFLDALDIPKAVLVGNSLGGRIATQVAVDHPDRVTGLVTMGSPGIEYQPTQTLRANTAPAITPEGIARVMATLAADGYKIPDGLVEFRYAMVSRPGGPEQWRTVVRVRDESVAASRLTAEQLASVTVPALILHGKQDKVVRVTDSFGTAQALPNADLMLFANCGHWVQLERESEFLTAVDGLLRRVSSEDGR
ncbi:hypothetical protein SGFS_022160 [Streptomyces graminofaciens]|uniref:AB hydrolase-1 domain-containing protein n=1 Tax=Streptomyces graminofaciens TaxID=68212 RepID=A0ABM7F513_9ACTN|nr:alpha/beta hydrolase [Streptomyces graminofaciens]BBC30922.1 hypothetical protein SGFS_022160 [Streptomyces graminofaciens]